MKRSTLYTIAVVAAIATLFFALTAGQAKQECTVCMDFRGGHNCAAASAVTEDEAIQTARNTACGPLAADMDATIACGNTQPTSIQCRSL